MTRKTFDWVTDPLIKAAPNSGRDGFFLMLRGAMVTDYCEDG